LIGWDYGLLNGNGDINKYVFSESLLGGSFISITIDWDRQVNLTDTNMNGRYNIGETFTSDGLTDLDLYLMPKGATALSQNIWSSISPVDSVEHIFHQIPITGDYEFWVLEVGPIAGNHPFQTYGAAWWAVPAAEPSTILIIMSGLCVLIIVRGLKLYV